MDFSEVAPTAEAIINMSPSELGSRMLPFLAKWPDGHAFSLAELKARVAGDEPNAFPMGSYARQHRTGIRQALTEAWEWLRNQGYLVPDDERMGGLKLSRQALSHQHPDPEHAISEAGRRERFARRESIGLETIENDLRHGGIQFVGGPAQIQALAREWVRTKKQKARENQMKRDPDLLFKLMERLEIYSDQPGVLYVFHGVDEKLDVDGYSSDQIMYHLDQLRKMGLVESPGSQPMIGITFAGLSARGHEFLERERSKSLSSPTPQDRTSSRKVFIVHGHDDGAREAIARFIERMGFNAIILHEQANQGRTVIEKVEAHGDAAFAIVLLSPDDEGAKKGEVLKPRARQNVILELGYFVGRLGRKHVCALTRGDVEIPSDFSGVVYERFDESGGWKQALGRELHAAGFDIDWNKVMRP